MMLFVNIFVDETMMQCPMRPVEHKVVDEPHQNKLDDKREKRRHFVVKRNRLSNKWINNCDKILGRDRMTNNLHKIWHKILHITVIKPKWTNDCFRNKVVDRWKKQRFFFFLSTIMNAFMHVTTTCFFNKRNGWILAGRLNFVSIGAELWADLALIQQTNKTNQTFQRIRNGKRPTTTSATKDSRCRASKSWPALKSCDPRDRARWVTCAIRSTTKRSFFLLLVGVGATRRAAPTWSLLWTTRRSASTAASRRKRAIHLLWNFWFKFDVIVFVFKTRNKTKTQKKNSR